MRPLRLISFSYAYTKSDQMLLVGGSLGRGYYWRSGYETVRGYVAEHCLITLSLISTTKYVICQEIGVAERCLLETVGARHINFIWGGSGMCLVYQCITRFIAHEYLKLSMNILPCDVT